MRKNLVRIVLFAVVCGVAAYLVWYFDVMRYVSLSFLQQKMSSLRTLVDAQYTASLLLYVIALGALIACMIPTVGPLTLLGGYLFGALVGTLAVLVGLVIGVTISFLIIRHFLASFLPHRWMRRKEVFMNRIQQYGAWYIFTLNVVTVVPFVVINTLAALSDITLGKFLVATVCGSFPMIAMYAVAGRQFATISSLSEIFSPTFIGILLLLAGFSCIPMIIKRITNMSIDDV